jgi:hypothetical protein
MEWPVYNSDVEIANIYGKHTNGTAHQIDKYKLQFSYVHPKCTISYRAFPTNPTRLNRNIRATKSRLRATRIISNNSHHSSVQTRPKQKQSYEHNQDMDKS